MEYIQDWEDKQRHWEESPVLPFFREVEEVEEDGCQDVENNGVQQQAGGNLLLQLLVLAAAFLQATYLLVTDCMHCDIEVLFISSISTNKGVNYAQKNKTSHKQQQRPELPMVPLTRHVSEHKVHELHQRYILY